MRNRFARAFARGTGTPSAGFRAAHARNRELTTEIRQLREQFARAHGELRTARLTSPAAAVSEASSYRVIPAERAAHNQ